jgi:GNAT superfamily N-acetyltransferase
MTIQEETKLQITIQNVDSLSKEQKEEIDAVDHLAFTMDGEEEADTIEWAMSSSWFVLGRLDDRLVSLIGVLNRTIDVSGQRLVIGGIGGVATHPDFQRRGFAAKLLQAAAEEMRRRGSDDPYDFAMLFCDPKLIPYYGKNGFYQVHNPIYILQSGRRVLFEDHQMVLPLSGKSWPEGDVDVNGPPW